jgi:hypothetical protein
MTEKVIEGHQKPAEGLKGLETVLGRDAEVQNALFGVQTPRIHTPLNDLPSRGGELIDLASESKDRSYGMAKICAYSHTQSQARR